MIFKSRQVNLDPEPWVENNEHGLRHLHVEGDDDSGCKYDPRPEFEPTRDPYPWASSVHSSSRYAANVTGDMRWMPRREQFDTPVNRVLVLFRRDAEHNGIDSALEYDWPTNSVASTPDEIDHARRVLTRLANWKER